MSRLSLIFFFYSLGFILKGVDIVFLLKPFQLNSSKNDIALIFQKSCTCLSFGFFESNLFISYLLVLSVKNRGNVNYFFSISLNISKGSEIYTPKGKVPHMISYNITPSDHKSTEKLYPSDYTI